MALAFIRDVLIPAIDPQPIHVLALRKEIAKKKEHYKRLSALSPCPGPALRRALDELEAEIRDDMITLQLMQQILRWDPSKDE